MRLLENIIEEVNTDGNKASQCQSIAFKNVGDVPVKVNQFLLNVGDGMLSFSNADPCAYDTTVYQIAFDKTVPGIDPRLQIIRTIVKP